VDRRCLSLALSVSLTAFLVAPTAILAQPQTQPTPAAQPPRPAATAQPRMSPAPMQPTTGAPSAQPAPSARPSGTNPQSNGQPAPPAIPVLPPVPDIAPGYEAPQTGTPAGEIVGVAQLPFVGISLEDAIAMALMRNTDLALAQSNRRIANYQIVAAEGAYDVRFQVSPQYSHSVSPPQSPFQSGPGVGPITQDVAGATTSLSGLTRGGQQYRVSASAQDVRTDNTSAGFDPSYPTALSFNVSQPLFRGRETNAARRQLLLARTNALTLSDVALVQASSTVTNVSNAYWDLVSAWRNVAIQEEGLKQAQAQAQSNSRLAARGQAAPVDIVESNTQVNVFQDNVFAALQNVHRLQTQIKSLVLGNPGDPLWMANLVPTSNVRQLPAEPALDDLFVQALRTRPEVAQLRDSRRAADINANYAKDQLKPQFDLNLGYTTNGFAGAPTDPRNNPIFGALGPNFAAVNALIARANVGLPPGQQIPAVNTALPTTPGYLTGKFGQSEKNLLDNRFPTYSVGVTYTIPLGNRTAKADYDIAREQQSQVQLQEIALLQRVKSEASNAIQTLRETRYRLIAAHNARTAAEQVYASEQRRFAAGTSTTYLVLQRSLDVANQRGRELQAQTDLNKAVVELQRVSGSIFVDNKIDVNALGAVSENAAKPNESKLP
jgi:outer membrane protein